MELGQFIKSILIEQRDGFLPWSFQAQPDSPVRWQTEGITDHVTNYKRQGTVILAVNGFVPQILEKNLQPASWNIVVGGDKPGIQGVALENEGCFGMRRASPNCFPRLMRFPQSLKAAGIQSELICKFGAINDPSEVHRIKLPGGVPAYLHSSISIGSGGRTIYLTVILRNRVEGSEMEHSTAICALLFKSQSGNDSEIAVEYLTRTAPQKYMFDY